MSTETRGRAIPAILTRERLGLATIDLVAVAGLVTYGYLHHSDEPLANPLGAVESITPFLIGWAIAAVLAGLYAQDTYANPTRAVRYTAIGWIGAANIGLIIRSTPLFEGGAAYPFNLVITGFGLLLLLLWRTAFAVVVR